MVSWFAEKLALQSWKKYQIGHTGIQAWARREKLQHGTVIDFLYPNLSLEIDLNIFKSKVFLVVVILFFYTDFHSLANHLDPRKFVQGWKPTAFRKFSTECRKERPCYKHPFGDTHEGHR